MNQSDRPGFFNFIKLVVIQLVFALLFIFNGGIETMNKVVDVKESSDNYKIITRYTEICQLSLSIEKSIVNFALILVLLFVFILMLLYMIFKAYEAKCKYDRGRATLSNRRAVTCVYCVILVTIVAALIVVIQPNFESISLLTPIISLILTSMAVLIIESCKLTTPNGSAIRIRTNSIKKTIAKVTSNRNGKTK